MSPTKWKNRNFFSGRDDCYFLWSLYKLYLQFLPTNLPTLGFAKLALHIFYFWVTISKTYSTWKPSYVPAYYLLVLVWLMRPHCLHTPWEKFFPVHSPAETRIRTVTKGRTPLEFHWVLHDEWHRCAMCGVPVHRRKSSYTMTVRLGFLPSGCLQPRRIVGAQNRLLV